MQVSYAVRMALWQYRSDADLTHACDPIAREHCGDLLTSVDESGTVVGAVGQCLLTMEPARVVSSECRRLVVLAGKEGGHSGGQVDASELEATLERLKQVRRGTA